MGEKILKYFNYMGNLEGFKGKIRLSQKIKIPVTQAAMMPDTLEYIEIFKKAIEELTGKPMPETSEKNKSPRW